MLLMLMSAAYGRAPGLVAQVRGGCSVGGAAAGGMQGEPACMADATAQLNGTRASSAGGSSAGLLATCDRVNRCTMSLAQLLAQLDALLPAACSGGSTGGVAVAGATADAAAAGVAVPADGADAAGRAPSSAASATAQPYLQLRFRRCVPEAQAGIAWGAAGTSRGGSGGARWQRGPRPQVVRLQQQQEQEQLGGVAVQQDD